MRIHGKTCTGLKQHSHDRNRIADLFNELSLFIMFCNLEQKFHVPEYLETFKAKPP